LRDEYEPDETDPPVIGTQGQAQRHNLYPANDLDRVKFLAQTGHWYRVVTSDLAPSVDTVLTVTVGNVSQIDKRHGPSEIVFQVEAGGDVWALVEVTNRGTYSPDSWYSLSVAEIPAPPTPTPTVVTPAPTPTSSALRSRLPGLASLSSVSDTGAVQFVITAVVRAGAP